MPLFTCKKYIKRMLKKLIKLQKFTKRCNIYTNGGVFL